MTKKRSSEAEADTSVRAVRGRPASRGRGGRGRKATGQVLMTSFTRTTTTQRLDFSAAANKSSAAANNNDVNDDPDLDLDDKVPAPAADAAAAPPVNVEVAPQAQNAGVDVAAELRARDAQSNLALVASKPRPKSGSGLSAISRGVLLFDVCFAVCDDTKACVLCSATASRSDNALRHFSRPKSMKTAHAKVLRAASEAEQARVSRAVAEGRVRDALATSVASLSRPLDAFVEVRKTPVVSVDDLSEAEKNDLDAVHREVLIALSINNNNLPMSYVDSLEFKAIALLAGWTVPSRKCLRARQYEILAVERNHLRAADVREMRVVNFTTDMWTKLHTPMIAVTGHYITSSFSMCEVLVGLVDMRAWDHTADTQETIAKHVIDTRLPINTTQFVTTADNTNVAIAVADRLSGGEGFGCVLHLMNLCVNDTFDNANHGVISAMLQKMRSVVSFFHRHELNGALREVQMAAGVSAGHLRVLQCDNKTRWFSKESMVDSSLSLQPFLTTMLDKCMLSLAPGETKESFLLSQYESMISRDLLVALGIVRNLSRVLERSHSPAMQLAATTLALIRYELQRIVSENILRGEVVAFTAALVANIDVRFNEMISSPSWPTVAAVLSPNHCELWHVTGAEVRSQLFSYVIDEFVKQSMFVDPPQVEVQPLLAPTDMSDDSDNQLAECDERKRRRDIAKKGIVAIRRLGPLFGVLEKSVLVSHAHKHLDGDADLAFWRMLGEEDWPAIEAAGYRSLDARQKENLTTFLSAFKDTIRAVLAVQPSSAASERCFSEAGWFLDDYTGDDLSFLEDRVRLRQLSRSAFSNPSECSNFCRTLALKILINRR